MEEGKKIGGNEGREDGIEAGKIETAKNMIAKGFSIEDIGDVTGLPDEVLNSLF